jgi:hypothetical protein
MPRDIIRTSNAPAPPPTYSQAVRAAGLVFVSGTGPHDPTTGKIVGDGMNEEWTKWFPENPPARQAPSANPRDASVDRSDRRSVRNDKKESVTPIMNEGHIQK